MQEFRDAPGGHVQWWVEPANLEPGVQLEPSPGLQAWGGRACKTQALSALLGVEPESNLRLDPLLVMWLGHWPMAFKYNDVSMSYNFVKVYPNLYQKQKAEH